MSVVYLPTRVVERRVALLGFPGGVVVSVAPGTRSELLERLLESREVADALAVVASMAGLLRSEVAVRPVEG